MRGVPGSRSWVVSGPAEREIREMMHGMLAELRRLRSEVKRKDRLIRCMAKMLGETLKPVSR